MCPMVAPAMLVSRATSPPRTVQERTSRPISPTQNITAASAHRLLAPRTPQAPQFRMDARVMPATMVSSRHPITRHSMLEHAQVQRALQIQVVKTYRVVVLVMRASRVRSVQARRHLTTLAAAHPWRAPLIPAAKMWPPVAPAIWATKGTFPQSSEVTAAVAGMRVVPQAPMGLRCLMVAHARLAIAAQSLPRPWLPTTVVSAHPRPALTAPLAQT